MNYISTQILNLTRQLFPKGRAYWIPPANSADSVIVTEDTDATIVDEDGDPLIVEDGAIVRIGDIGTFENLMKAFGGNGENQTGTLERLRSDSASFLDSLVPDNANFTDGTADPNDNDCNDWERRVGLVQYGVTSATTPTRQQRMDAIRAKMNYPGSNACRQSAGYLQNSLQAAGFPVYVYENLGNLSPDDVLGIVSGAANLGSFDLGASDLGEEFAGTLIANYVDEARDAVFTVPDPNFHGTFFISGSPITTFADVPAVRKAEFRQLILKLKPAQLAGFLFINYT